MFSSGNTDRLAKPGKKMLGLDALRTSSNEMGVQIPWFCGRARLGVTYISRMFSVQRTKVKSGGKGGKVSAYSYKASFAALLGFGPVDRLFHIIGNDDLLWSEDTGSPTERPGAGTNYVDITVEQLGVLRVYWGTDTQTADPGLVYDGIEHPAYRGFCYVRSLGWELGQFSGGDVPAPNLELLAGRYPVPSWWALGSVKIGQDINPAAAIWDLLLPVRKNGIPATRIDQTSLISIAATLDAEGLGISPLVNQAKTIRESLVDICQTIGGYYRESATGVLTFGLHRPVGSVPGFSPSDMTQRPSISPGAWTKTTSGAQVRFRNGDLYMNEDVASDFDLANFSLTGRSDSPAVDRLMVTEPETAQKLANAAAQAGGIPSGSGTLSLRKSKVGTLKIGDRFTFSYPQLGITSLSAVAVAIEHPEPGRPEVVVDWEADKTQTLAGVFSPSTYTPPTSALLTPVLSPRQFGWELLGDGAPDHAGRWFGFAAVPPTLAHNSFAIWREFPDASSDYVDSGDQYAAWTPELYLYGASINSSVTSIEVYLGPVALLSGMLGIGDVDFDGFPSADIDAGKVYIALDAGGFGGSVEVCKVTALAPGGGAGRYALTIVRGQWGTTAASHSAWSTIGVQSSVALINTDNFARVTVAATFATESFLLQPAIAGRRADITTLVPIVITTSVESTPAPANLRVFGDRLNPGYTTGQSPVIEWDATVIDAAREDIVARTSTELRIYDAPGTTLKSTIAIAATVQSYTWTNASLVTALGSETDFVVRAYQVVDGAYSASYAILTVKKL